MPNFMVSYEGHYYYSPTNHRFFDYTKDEVIKLAKQRADEKKYRTIYIAYLESGKTVGYWEKKGSRWYRM